MAGHTSQRSSWSKLLPGLGIVSCLGGTLFLLDAIWQIGHEHIQRTGWSAAEAHIEACSIYEASGYAGTPNSKQVPSKSTYVRCKLLYQAEGKGREITIKVGDAISTYGNHRPFFTSKLTVDKMRAWIARHRSGSSLPIRYDPSDPESVSLAGDDSELKAATPVERLWFGIFAGGVGLLIVVAAKRARPAGPAGTPLE